jgi:hypothetical protein
MVNVLGVPVKIVCKISGETVPMINRYSFKAYETQLRIALQNVSHHFPGTQEEREISHPSQILSNQHLKYYHP